MPSGYAHYRFGMAMLTQMPADIKRAIQRFRPLFDMGLHGPDIFYYTSPLIKANAGFLGIKYHEQTGREFFIRACRMLRMERSEAGNVYLYGLLCHYCLDSVMHPAVLAAVARGAGTHVGIETEFDRYLLELDGKAPADIQKLRLHMRLTAGETDTVARFYPPADGRYIRNSISGMAGFTKLIAAGGARRKLLEVGIRLGGKEMEGMLMPKQAAPESIALDAELLAVYQQAAAQLPKMLQQLISHMTYSAPFGSEFDAAFCRPERAHEREDSL